MNLKRNLLRNSLLYALIDKEVLGKRDPVALAGTMARLPIGMVQFRDKISSKKDIFVSCVKLSRVFTGAKTLFIINDHIDIAQCIPCQGVHIGQDDLPIKIARKLIGKDKLIGRSCHSIAQALCAQDEGADYISLGPIFATPTKPQYRAVGLALIRACAKKIQIPFFAIGGLTLRNLKQVRSAGAKRVAVCRAVLDAQNISETVKEFDRLLRQ
jgi:thiamine-phosphate pyrophosphorylase